MESLRKITAEVLFLLQCLCLLSFQGYAQIQPFSPNIISVNDGDQVSLDCEVHQSSVGDFVQWYHDSETAGTTIISHGDTILTQRSGFSINVSPDTQDSTINHWVLSINNLNADRDTGTWRCGGEQYSDQTVQLLILAEPRIVFVTQELTPQVGSTVELECVAEGNPEPGLAWARTYPETYIAMSDGSKRGFTRAFGTNVLAFSQISSSHRGEYVCAATNGHSEAIIRTTYVHLPYAPEVRASRERIRVVEGREATLACVSQAYPATSSEQDVQWMKDGEDVKSLSGHYVDVSTHPDSLYGERFYSQLRIAVVQSEHLGTYECSFTNSEGTGSATVMLHHEPEIDHNFGAKGFN